MRVSGNTINQRPAARPGEVLEAVPGLIVGLLTQTCLHLISESGRGRLQSLDQPLAFVIGDLIEKAAHLALGKGRAFDAHAKSLDR